MPRLTEEQTRLLLSTFADVMRAVRRNAGKRGSRLSVLAQRLRRSFPEEQFLRVMDLMGNALGRRTDEVVLLVGSHAEVKGTVKNLNEGVKAWLTAYHGPMQGRKVSLRVVREVEESAAVFFLESHHVVEKRVRKFYGPDLFPYWEPGTTVPDPDRMITMAIPAGLHRGARYVPIEAKSPRLEALRKKLPDRSFNLTDELEKEFPDSYFEPEPPIPKPPFPVYLRKLADFYKSRLPELYPTVVLPNGEKGGILSALERIAADTGHSIEWP